MDIALAVVDRIGKSLEPRFSMTDDVEKAYIRLIQWFHGDPEFKGYLERGLMLMGPTGSGKTLAMNIMSRYRDIDNIFFIMNGKSHRLIYDVVDVNNINKAFMQNGYDGISVFSNRYVLCIDDLGYETGISKRFGNTEDVVSYIIGERYVKKLITFATTNLPLESLEDSYDDRTYSRICGMFNFVTMKGHDFRKVKL